MLTIVKVIHMSWIVLFCCAQLSSVQGASDHTRHSTDFTEAPAYMAPPVRLCLNGCKIFPPPPRKYRLPRDISSTAERSSLGIERATMSPDLVKRFQGRERKKQWRLLESLIQLNGMIGSRNRTRVGDRSAALSATEVESIKRRLDENYEGKLRKDPNIKKIITLFPTCPSPTVAKNKAFRLFFSIIPPERTLRTPVINVKSAVLHLTRKPLKADLVNGNFDGSDNRKYRGKRVNAAHDHVTRWKVRIQAYNMPNGETKKAFKYFDLDPQNSAQWVRVSILKVVEEWLKTSRKNLGLQLMIVNGKNHTIDPFDVFHDFSCNLSGNHLAVAIGDGGEIDEGLGLRSRGRLLDANDSISAASIPHLEVVMAKAPQNSAKRIVRHLPNKKNPCTMIPILVKLADLKGRWKKRIIAPMNFQSNVCKGTCHRCLSSSSANITQPRNGSESGGCCQPIKWKALKALQRDDQEAFRYGDIPVWAVTKCGCRR